MTASTKKTGYAALRGRLNGNKAWCAQSPSGTQDWLKVELEMIAEICGVATQGREDTDEYVISFKLEYSLDGGGWMACQDSNGYDKVNLLFSLEGAVASVERVAVYGVYILAWFLPPSTTDHNPAFKMTTRSRKRTNIIFYMIFDTYSAGRLSDEAFLIRLDNM